MGLEQELEIFGQPGSYLQEYPKVLKAKRDQFVKSLMNVGLQPTIPQAGYFITVNWTGVENKVDLNKETDNFKDFRFVKTMIKDARVQGLPLSAFYGEEHKPNGEEFIRFCFVKVVILHM